MPQEPAREAEAAARDLPAGPSTAAAAAAGAQQQPRRSDDAGAASSSTPGQGAPQETGLGRAAFSELSAAGTAGAAAKHSLLLML